MVRSGRGKVQRNAAQNKSGNFIVDWSTHLVKWLNERMLDDGHEPCGDLLTSLFHSFYEQSVVYFVALYSTVHRLSRVPFVILLPIINHSFAIIRSESFAVGLDSSFIFALIEVYTSFVTPSLFVRLKGENN